MNKDKTRYNVFNQIQQRNDKFEMWNLHILFEEVDIFCYQGVFEHRKNEKPDIKETLQKGYNKGFYCNKQMLKDNKKVKRLSYKSLRQQYQSIYAVKIMILTNKEEEKLYIVKKNKNENQPKE